MAMIKKVRDLLFQTGLFDVVYRMRPHHLTVLAYHRITDPDAPGFDTFRPNVSARPADFAAQMDFVQARFHVVSVDQVVAWIEGEGALPPRPLLITFDDGYRDNFTYAFPVLQQRNLPAVIFLTTGAIGGNELFWWDTVAYCFNHTPRNEAEIPLVGHAQWPDATSRTAAMEQYLAALKQVPEPEKRSAVAHLPGVLEVEMPEQGFADYFLTWDNVRTMVTGGVAMGAHTQSHPIMTRIPLEQARAEATGSRERIGQETGQPVKTFAYTNGLESDFNEAVQGMLQDEGFAAAFTLLPGPMHRERVRREPMAIRRVAISNKDTLSRFAAKLLGRP